MADRKLTDLISKDSSSLQKNNIVYIVDPSDTTSDPAGTSYKTDLGAIIEAVKLLDGNVINGIGILDDTAKLNISQIPESPYFTTPGQVVILNGDNGSKPFTNNQTSANQTPSPEEIFDYLLPLTLAPSPITNWSSMETQKIDASIWDDINITYLENKSLGQVHLWKFNFTYIKPLALTTSFYINIRFYNKFTNVGSISSFYISSNAISGSFTMDFESVANSNSLAVPLGTGQGYSMSSSIIGATGSYCDITLQSMTRVSLLNTYVAP
tara:strand:+ start:1128 stop:1931 length:804 start_codon:yes stop_codon:yes gene_type:complete